MGEGMAILLTFQSGIPIYACPDGDEPLRAERQKEHKTGLGGFEPPASGLEARRYVQAKPQALIWTPITFALVDNICFLNGTKKRFTYWCSILSMILSSRSVILSSFSSVV